MKNTKEFNSRFLTDTDETGRFIVTSQVTGKKYFVEPLDGPPVQWGDLNPATKKIEGSYGQKYKGSIKPEESLITKENGFDDIVILGAGESPFSEIHRRDLAYQNNLKKLA